MTMAPEQIGIGIRRYFTRPGVHPYDTVEWEPLTISPSVLCQCGDHGFIRNGKWVVA